MSENFERAATIAVFQGRIRRGIASLKDGAGIAQQKGNTTKSMYISSHTHTHNKAVVDLEVDRKIMYKWCSSFVVKGHRSIVLVLQYF